MIITPSHQYPQIYFGDTSNFASINLIEMLSADEIIRSASFKNEKDSSVYIMSRALLRKLLGPYLKTAPQQIIISYSSNGKPYLKDYPQIKFNISHSYGAFAIAISLDYEIGLDIEPQNRKFDYQKLKSFLYSDSELHMGEDMFLKVWTIKEAIMKAKGIGLTQPLNEIILSEIVKEKTTLSTEIVKNHLVSCYIEGEVESPHIIYLDGFNN